MKQPCVRPSFCPCVSVCLSVLYIDHCTCWVCCCGPGGRELYLDVLVLELQSGLHEFFLELPASLVVHRISTVDQHVVDALALAAGAPREEHRVTLATPLLHRPHSARSTGRCALSGRGSGVLNPRATVDNPPRGWRNSPC